MALPDRPVFTSPYDIRLVLDGFNSLLKKGTPMEELARLATKYKNQEIRQAIDQLLLRRTGTVEQQDGGGI